MNLLPIAIGVLFGVGGVALLVRATARPLVNVDAVLAGIDGAEPHLDEFTERVATPFIPRLLRPAGARAVGMVRALLPGNYVDRVRHKLAVAGLSERMTGEEFIAIQVASIGAGVLGGLVIALSAGWTLSGVFRSMLLFAIVGAL